MKVLVIDLDDTLFKRGLLTKLCWRLSRWLHKLGIWFEKLDEQMLKKLNSADVKIVLSGRAKDWMQTTTLEQLEAHSVKVDEVLLCPRAKLYYEWKEREISRLVVTYSELSWLDNDVSCKK